MIRIYKNSKFQENQIILGFLSQIEAEADNTRRFLNVDSVCKKYNLGFYRKLVEDSPFKHPPTPQYSAFYMIRFVKLTSRLISRNDP